MVTGRTKGMTFRGKGNVVLVAAQLDDADGNPTEEYVLLRADEFGRLRTVGGGAAVSTFLALTDTPASYVGQSLLGVRVNAGEDALEFAAIPAHAPMMPQIDDVGLTSWNIPGWGMGSMGNAVIGADDLWYLPVYVERSRTFTQIGLHVIIAGAGGTVARLGIYAATFDGSGDLTPGALTLDAGTVSVATTGQKSIAISVTLAQGFHFFAISSDGTPTMTRPSSSGVTQPVTAIRNAINSAHAPNFRVDVVDGAAALPDPAPTPTDQGTSSAVWVQIGE